jgi:hypothetical protein
MEGGSTIINNIAIIVSESKCVAAFCFRLLLFRMSWFLFVDEKRCVCTTLKLREGDIRVVIFKIFSHSEI